MTDRPPDGDHKERWHLKKEVSYGHLISTLVLIIGVAGYAVANEHRITAIEARNTATQTAVDQEADIRQIHDGYLSLQIDREAVELGRDIVEIKDSLKEILAELKGKVDREPWRPE